MRACFEESTYWLHNNKLYLKCSLTKKQISAESHVVSVTVASLQFLISSSWLLPVGLLKFTLILYAASPCLFYCPRQAITKTGTTLMCFLIGS